MITPKQMRDKMYAQNWSPSYVGKKIGVKAELVRDFIGGKVLTNAQRQKIQDNYAKLFYIAATKKVSNEWTPEPLNPDNWLVMQADYAKKSKAMQPILDVIQTATRKEGI